MANSKTMKIFFEGMQGSFLGDGYGSKIISTPMGPFRWNDTMELWENVNNGMVMNNMSFQDLMSMGYETLGGGGDYSETPDKKAALIGSFGNLEGVSVAKASRWASTTGPQTAIGSASKVTITNINRPIQISLTNNATSGKLTTLKYSVNVFTGSGTNYSTPFTVNSGDQIIIGAIFPDSSGIPVIGEGTITVKNVSDGNAVLATVAWSYEI